MSNTIVGDALPNMPWEEKPADCMDVVWRYSGNPVIGWNPIPQAARVYNSAGVPYQGAFAGVFRADKKIRRVLSCHLYCKKPYRGYTWIKTDFSPEFFRVLRYSAVKYPFLP